MAREVAKASAPESGESGTWYTSGVETTVVCPNLHASTLDAYTIEDDGSVSPVFQCLVEGCGFRDGIKLTGWTTQ